ncbi:Manganese transport system membrane protein MntB [Crateriforma conspicua]|uniref:Manganese transport system membrane protein MntB n=1 Tax=Crateriforma conspicua TaxID=2527996 RepID=A0A5C6FUZ3_9PLAN|nr:Manganese transport system membrane protein MntB [Crateriforma conspicua]
MFIGGFQRGFLRRPFGSAAVGLVILVLLISVASGPTAFGAEGTSTLTDRSVTWPTWSQWQRVLTFRDYNSRVVILGTAVLGCAGGLVGSFTLLRGRALLGDAISHASLPGIALAFLIASAAGLDGKSLPTLLFGATISGLIGVAVILLIRNLTRLHEDAALGIVLSVFFGAGIALLGIVQQTQTGHAAGLEAFIYGKTASMGLADAKWIIAASGVAVTLCVLLFKEFKLLCFDESFAASRGLPVLLLDIALMSLVVAVSIVGLQAVGLVLMIALLVIPAAAARFWTQRMAPMTLIAATLGAISGIIGAAMSALFSKLPSGAMIVLVCTAFFAFSMFLGPQKGILGRTLRRLRLNRKIERQHLLRAIYETLERDASGVPDRFREFLSMQTLLPVRSWTPRQLERTIDRAQDDDLVRFRDRDQHVRLTRAGVNEAARLTRQHRLWELYLINYADIAPGRVDRDADAIEHVLEPEVVAELEDLLQHSPSRVQVPESPHPLDHGGAEDSGSGAKISVDDSVSDSQETSP